MIGRKDIQQRLRELWREYRLMAGSVIIIGANVAFALLPTNPIAPLNWITVGYMLGHWMAWRHSDKTMREFEQEFDRTRDQLNAMISHIPAQVQAMSQGIVDEFIVQMKRDGHLPPGFDARIVVGRGPFDPSKPTVH